MVELARLPLIVTFPLDIQVSRRGVIFIGARNRQFDRPVRQQNRVGIRPGIGGLDGRSQGDMAGGILAGLEIHGDRVEQSVDLERRENTTRLERFPTRTKPRPPPCVLRSRSSRGRGNTIFGEQSS